MASLNPPPCVDCIVTFPTPQILLLTLNRPKAMNSITHSMAWHIHRLLTWFDKTPSLRVAVITGAGLKAFCAGSDLLEIERAQQAKHDPNASPVETQHPPTGFAGVSRRRGKKPVLVAVNGLALGGGFEIVLNCDVVIAAPHAQFGLPEPLVGVYAYGGGLPRLVRLVGMQAASDIALTGRRVSAREALDLRLISSISKSPESVLDETLEKAKQIANVSPDGVMVTRAALREAWETASVERAFQVTHEQMYEDLMKSENSKEGLAAFREKRPARWMDSKL
jgi:enoyl-CoA hydratase/carnithine racemase